jgi:DNA-binding NarL/FixJ family response regulator
MTLARSARRVVVLSPLRVLVESLGTELLRAGFADVLDAVPTGGVSEQATDGKGDLLFLYDGSTSGRLDGLSRDLGVQQLSCTVVFGLAESARDLAVCVRLGVPGLLRRDASLEQFLAALDVVSQGGVFMLPPVRDALVHGLGGTAMGTPPERLTPKEHEVALLVARGLSNKEIARELRAGLGTVKFHVRQVMAKLGLHQRAGVGAALGTSGGDVSAHSSRDAERVGRGMSSDRDRDAKD